MSTLREQQEELRIALLDLAFVIVDALGLLRLSARLGMKDRMWVRQARWRQVSR